MSEGSPSVKPHRPWPQDLTAKTDPRSRTDGVDTVRRVQLDVDLYTRTYPAEGALKGAVLLVHGGGWHSGWYTPFAQRLTAEGLAVVAYDLRGHGLSGRVDGLDGFVWGFEDHVSDCVAQLEHTQQHFPGVPCFVFGECFGAAIVLSAMTHASDPAVQGVAGLMLGGPLLRTDPKLLPPSPLVALLGLVAWPLPKLQLPGDQEKEFDGMFGDPAKAAEARADPLVQVSPAAYLRPTVSVLRTLRTLLTDSQQLTVPWIILHGDADPSTEPAASQAMFDGSICEDKTLKHVPGAAHKLLQDKPEITKQAIQTWVDWVSVRTAAA